MAERDLLTYFIEHYYTKREIAYRLPVSVAITEFWPEELRLRQEKAVTLPLRAVDGGAYWYVPTPRFLEAGDALAQTARLETRAEATLVDRDFDMMDEAFYSSAIEGAFSTKAQARELLRSGMAPKTKDERMIANNYEALRFVSEHLDTPIHEALVLRIAEILTEETLEEGIKPGWRDGPVQVVSPRLKTIYVAPDADQIRPMLEDLFAFLAREDIHPIIKACAAHIYFVTVHPLFDGNGRTARALAYMILLQAGYDFLRQVPISGLLLEERPKYYKAIQAAQESANGNDFTYFMEYYADMLFRSAQSLRTAAEREEKLETLKKRTATLAASERLCKGMEWLYAKDFHAVTVEKWKDKFNVSFETARKDLMRLVEYGYLSGRVSGHKKYFDIV